MTPPLRKGLVLALCHVAIVASLGVKLEIDRATRPRVWARAMPFDPNLPIRGRYVSLTLEVAADGVAAADNGVSLSPVALVARDGALVAGAADASSHVHIRSTTRERARVPRCSASRLRTSSRSTSPTRRAGLPARSCGSR